MKNKWNQMSASKKNTIEIILALILVTAFFAFRLYSNYLNAKKESQVSKEVHLVTDNSRYFTVIGCVEKYLSTVQSGDSSKILSILNDDYKDDFNVTVNNLQNHIPNLSNGIIYSYVGREMYEKRISKNVVEYYVYGNIEGSLINEAPTKSSYDMTVILYENEFLFSIRPGVNI